MLKKYIKTLVYSIPFYSSFCVWGRFPPNLNVIKSEKNIRLMQGNAASRKNNHGQENSQSYEWKSGREIAYFLKCTVPMSTPFLNIYCEMRIRQYIFTLDLKKKY